MCTCVVELDVHVLNFNVHCARSVRCAHVLELDVQVLNMQCASVKLKCACVLELDVQERAME